MEWKVKTYQEIPMVTKYRKQREIMAKYHLVHTDSKSTFFNLTRFEMVSKLKLVHDLNNWFCWYPGLQNWKQVSQAPEIKEWMSFHWTADQTMPPWQDLFTKRAKGKDEDFEVIEFNDVPTLSPPPLPEPIKTEFVISNFSGQVFDFDESLKDKHLNEKEFKIQNDNEKTEIVSGTSKFENTIKVDTSSNDFDKTIAGNTQLINEGTVKVDLNATDFEKTVANASSQNSNLEKTNIVEAQVNQFDKTISTTTELIHEKTMKVDTSGRDFDLTMRSNTALTEEKTQTSATAIAPEQTAKVQTTQPLPSFEITAKSLPLPDLTLAKGQTPSPETPTVRTEEAQQATQPAQQANDSQGGKKHNRRYPRIKGRLRTIITNKSKAFMTFTKDISLGGIQVENMIPKDILVSEIEVYLSDPTGKKSILFRCHPVGDMTNPCRFSFAKADEKALQKLSQWLDDLAKITAA
jgi:hypothetical protein